MKKKYLTFTVQWTRRTAAAVLSFLLLLLCIGPHFISYVCAVSGRIANAWLLAGGSLCLCAAAWLVLHRRKDAEQMTQDILNRQNQRMALLTLLSFFLTWLVMSQAALRAPWDGHMLYVGTRERVNGTFSFEFLREVIPYPNNRLFAVIMMYVWQLADLLGLQGMNAAYVLLLPVQCACSSIAIWCVYRCAMLTFARERPAAGVLAWVVAWLMLGLNPQITQNYSDVPAVALIGICSVLALRIREGRGVPLLLGLLSFISVIGYHLKPQICFVLIAAVPLVLIPWIMEICR